MCVVFEELYYAANNQNIADKKKANYQEALEKHEAMTATWKTRRKVMHEAVKVIWRIRKRVVLIVQHEAAKVIWRIWKSHADTAAQSHEIYEKNLEKSR